MGKLLSESHCRRPFGRHGSGFLIYRQPLSDLEVFFSCI
ncbi:hypothetical protein GPEL0_01r0876 [Geoanaerobacter pelophilus]|uniref:Uncharacterized protein n=1 Tax=Geoanaerobacter pelophilus TaxID=60036 RepID=A0ABQ0MFD9_9BACT|nr:hypothetical protein GPEL0_01r0876 [Geoanaerobacter pelophilus]